MPTGAFPCSGDRPFAVLGAVPGGAYGAVCCVLPFPLPGSRACTPGACTVVIGCEQLPGGAAPSVLAAAGGHVRGLACTSPVIYAVSNHCGWVLTLTLILILAFRVCLAGCRPVELEFS